MEGKQKVESFFFIYIQKETGILGWCDEWNPGYIILYSLSVKQGVISKEAATMIWVFKSPVLLSFGIC